MTVQPSKSLQQCKSLQPLKPLKGIRILSLALNLPGPAALMRCQQMGARCVKLEPPAPKGAASSSGDPMHQYNLAAYAALHQDVRIASADLKTDVGQKMLHKELAKTDVLLTSFRPSALIKLGLSWALLHQQYPQLSQVAIVGGPGELSEAPGHDLTYLAAMGLVTGLELPATLYADMGGSLMASEAVLQTVLHSRQTGKGVFVEVALASAANYMALPRGWGLTTPGAAVGGGHAGYRIYRCKNGRVAVAALEPHFAQRLCVAAGFTVTSPQAMFAADTHYRIASWLLGNTRAQLDHLAADQDIPMHTMV